ncbi:PD-(D/E)XK motif protein [Myxococcota bacterium]|nr:PD-(D/E)XK motif protein [Myxococcota bacterium]MBU1430286.1 PD-(D/E)XK motif protein [Myxococcota bacterium]
MLDYRTIANKLEVRDIPLEPGVNNVFWMVDHRLAIGRSHDSGYVIILPGTMLSTDKPELSKALSYGRWKTNEGKVLEANRITLPEGHSFAMATATVAAELIRQGIESHPLEEVFQAVDDFIERLLGDLFISEHALVGLLGEMVFLERMLRLPTLCDAVADPTSIWRGFLHDAHDFHLGSKSIEVKTTTGDNRIHTIHSLAQIEPRTDINGNLNEDVFLLSVGFRVDDINGSYSVPNTVDKILLHINRCREPEIAKKAFLQRLLRWGVSEQTGYKHDTARVSSRMSIRFALSLEPRLYELTDPKLKLLRSKDLVGFIVENKGIRYRANFPDEIPGNPENPIVGWYEISQKLI